LGGKSVSTILEEADIDLAVEGAFFAGAANGMRIGR
jgi:acyl-CoA reductase-like NAD-dependent aldehyde dehydrogenase